MHQPTDPAPTGAHPDPYVEAVLPPLDPKRPAAGDLAVAVIIMSTRVSDAHTRAALSLSGLTRHRWQRIALNRQRAMERLVWALRDSGGAR